MTLQKDSFMLVLGHIHRQAVEFISYSQTEAALAMNYLDLQCLGQ